MKAKNSQCRIINRLSLDLNLYIKYCSFASCSWLQFSRAFYNGNILNRPHPHTSKCSLHEVFRTEGSISTVYVHSRGRLIWFLFAICSFLCIHLKSSNIFFFDLQFIIELTLKTMPFEYIRKLYEISCILKPKIFLLLMLILLL